MGRLRTRPAAVTASAKAPVSSLFGSGPGKVKAGAALSRPSRPTYATRRYGAEIKVEDVTPTKLDSSLASSQTSSTPQLSFPEAAVAPSRNIRTSARQRSKVAMAVAQAAQGRKHQTRQRTRLETKLSALRSRGTQLMDLPPEIRLVILQALLSSAELLSLRKGTYVEPKQPPDFPQNMSWHDLYCPDFTSSEVEAYAAILALADGAHNRTGYVSSVYAMDSRFATARGKARTLIEEAGEIFWRNRFWVGLDGARGLEFKGGIARHEGASRVRRVGCEVKYFSHEEGDNAATGALNWLYDDKYTSLNCVDVCVKGSCAGGYCRASSSFLSQVSKAVKGLAAKRGTASLTWEYPYEGVMNGSYTVTRPRPWVSSSSSLSEAASPSASQGKATSENEIDKENEDPRNTVPVEDLVLGSTYTTSPSAGREELEHRYDGRKCFRGFHGPWGWLSWKKRGDGKLWRTLRIGCACGTVFWEDARVEEAPTPPSSKKAKGGIKTEPMDLC